MAPLSRCMLLPALVVAFRFKHDQLRELVLSELDGNLEVPTKTGGPDQAVSTTTLGVPMPMPETVVSMPIPETILEPVVSEAPPKESLALLYENFVLPYRFTAMGLILTVMLWLSMGTEAAVAGPAKALAVVLCWAYASVSMSLLNKHATAIFPMTALLVLLQMVIAIVILLLFEGRGMRVGSWRDLRRWVVVPLFYTGVLASGMWALKVTTLSTVLILRNVLPLCTFGAEKALFNQPKQVTLPTVASMLVVVLGSVLYAHGNLSVTGHAAGFILLNCVLVVCDRMIQRKLLAAEDFSLSPSVCLLVNNAVGMVLMLLLAFCSGEVYLWKAALSSTDSTTCFWIVLTGLNGCVLGYLGIRCQRLISATTFLVLQNSNKVVLILLSMAFFGDVVSGVPLAGCALSMLGSAWYGAMRLPQETAAPKAAPVNKQRNDTFIQWTQKARKDDRVPAIPTLSSSASKPKSSKDVSKNPLSDDLGARLCDTSGEEETPTDRVAVHWPLDEAEGTAANEKLQSFQAALTLTETAGTAGSKEKLHSTRRPAGETSPTSLETDEQRSLTETCATR